MVKRQGNLMRRLTFFCAVGFFVLSAFGCGGGGGGDTSTGGGGGGGTTTQTPSISTQGALDFGVVVIPQTARTLSRTVTITNSGTATLTVGQIELQQQSGTPSFVIANDSCSNTSIAASSTCQVAVQFTTGPTSVQNDISSVLNIPSNDAASPKQLQAVAKIRKYFVNINEVSREQCSSGNKLQLFVSVTNGNDLFVNGLTDANFELFEGSTQKAFSPVSVLAPPGLTVSLLLDNSPSITDPALIADAAQFFIGELNDNQDEVRIVKFSVDTQSSPASGFTAVTAASKVALNAFLGSPFTGDTSGTDLYGTLFNAVGDFSVGTKLRRAIVLLSDGYDDFAVKTKTLDEAIAQAFNAGIPVFTIAITKAVVPKPEIMKEIALQTGGAYFEAADESELTAIYGKIVAILADQYLIEYVTSAGVGPITLYVDVLEGVTVVGEAARDALGCP